VEASPPGESERERWARLQLPWIDPRRRLPYPNLKMADNAYVAQKESSERERRLTSFLHTLYSVVNKVDTYLGVPFEPERRRLRRCIWRRQFWQVNESGTGRWETEYKEAEEQPPSGLDKEEKALADLEEFERECGEENGGVIDKQTAAEIAAERAELEESIARQRWSVCSSGSTWQKIYERELAGSAAWRGSFRTQFEHQLLQERVLLARMVLNVGDSPALRCLCICDDDVLEAQPINVCGVVYLSRCLRCFELHTKEMCRRPDWCGSENDGPGYWQEKEAYLGLGRSMRYQQYMRVDEQPQPHDRSLPGYALYFHETLTPFELNVYRTGVDAPPADIEGLGKIVRELHCRPGMNAVGWQQRDPDGTFYFPHRSEMRLAQVRELAVGQAELPAGVLRLPDVHVSNDAHSGYIGGFCVIPPLSRFEELLQWVERCAVVVPPYRRSDFRTAATSSNA